MVQLHFAKGVARVSLDNQAESTMPIFLDARHRVVEVPSQWIMWVAKKASRSNETLQHYSQIMFRYLQWLEAEGYGPHAWDRIDEDIFEKFVESLCSPGIKASSVQYYCARIKSFYTWAEQRGYKHFLDFETDALVQKVGLSLKNQLLLAHVNSSIAVKKVGISNPLGWEPVYEQEAEKFVTERNHRIALSFFDDMVYQVIATVIWTTGLRPRDLLQIPYRGKDHNSDFIPYDADDIPSDLDSRQLNFLFRSKGKHRSIEFPGMLWQAICKHYIPVRRHRAELHRQKYGVTPNNQMLFLTKEGEPVKSHRMRYAFGKVCTLARAAAGEADDKQFSGRRYNPRMLRHSFATYFVYEHLKSQDLIGKPYQYNPAVDEKLRRMLGHSDIETTYKFYVHLVNRFHSDDLLRDLKNSHVNHGLNNLLDAIGY